MLGKLVNAACATGHVRVKNANAASKYILWGRLNIGRK
jgi:hypothetical protein